MPRKEKAEPNKVRQTFTIRPSVLQDAKRKSEQTGVSMSHVVESALHKWTEGSFDPKK